jgi:hypothetical protein
MIGAMGAQIPRIDAASVGFNLSDDPPIDPHRFLQR